MRRLLFVFGTRPEAIKMARLIDKLKSNPRLETRVAITAQHRQMLDQVLDLFGITPNYDLNVMAENQDLFDISSRVLSGLKPILIDARPDLMLVQGDTTTTFIASLAAFYMRIPVAHIEAGLRTGNRYSPFPEEINRKLTTSIAALHFAPTPLARRNLLVECVRDDAIHVTGNTSIDALLWIINNRRPDFDQSADEKRLNFLNRRFILVTTHRRESFGAPMQRIMRALAVIASRFPELPVVFPVHFNPNVRVEVDKFLHGIPNVHLMDPMDYLSFAHLMNRSYLILTDSGGVQEEAPSLGKPLLVLRDTTERPEGIEAGSAMLVGTDFDRIVSETCRLLTDQTHYNSMASVNNPYGDGHAAERITTVVERFLLGD